MSKVTFIKQSPKKLIAQLEAIRSGFSPAEARQKKQIIMQLGRMAITNAKELIEYHEILCFMQAYPDNHEISRLADSELLAFPDRLERYRQKRAADARLDDTGMANTIIHYPYNLYMARWLAARFSPAVDIDWDDYNEKEGDPLSGLLPIFALYMENDGVDDEDLATSDWIKMAAGKENNTLRWLILQLDRLEIPADIRHYIYENSELMLKWDLGKSKAARTLAKLHDRSIFYQESPIKKERIDLSRSIRKGAPVFDLCSAEKATDVKEILIRALLPRHRELYPATFANPEEVYIMTPGAGLEIYILGMMPEYRMPLESNYSALLIKNGVPIGYGISVIFFDRCEIAINVFDSFRSGEASAIFEHFTRIFYHHFGARNFLMRKWQVGHENEEGIKSGSYWFYYKLGFQSIDQGVDELAKREWQKIKSDKRYRTPERILKKLALSDMHIAPGRKSTGAYKELSVINLGYAVTRMVADRFGGDRGLAFQWATDFVKTTLGINQGNWNKAEQLQFQRFSPLLAMIADLENWDDVEKRDLLEVIKAKAGPREIDYICKLQSHNKLQEAFRKLAGS